MSKILWLIMLSLLGYYLRHGLGILNVLEQGMDDHGPLTEHMMIESFFFFFLSREAYTIVSFLLIMKKSVVK